MNICACAENYATTVDFKHSELVGKTEVWRTELTIRTKSRAN